MANKQTVDWKRNEIQKKQLVNCYSLAKWFSFYFKQITELPLYRHCVGWIHTTQPDVCNCRSSESFFFSHSRSSVLIECSKCRHYNIDWNKEQRMQKEWNIAKMFHLSKYVERSSEWVNERTSERTAREWSESSGAHTRQQSLLIPRQVYKYVLR